MNLIMLYPEDYITTELVSLRDYRHHHVRDIHRAQTGDTLRVGNYTGLLGQGEVVKLDDSELIMRVRCDEEPPQPLPVTLLLALPRPKVLKRVLISATTLGIKRIYLCNSWRVDKSYWSSPSLTREEITRQLVTGLEQAVDTMAPQVVLRPRFKPFVEDEVPQLIENSCAFVAHPGSESLCPSDLSAACRERGRVHCVIAVGPEGGFIPYEVEKLIDSGFQPVTMGARVLRVETAITWLAARIQTR